MTRWLGKRVWAACAGLALVSLPVAAIHFRSTAGGPFRKTANCSTLEVLSAFPRNLLFGRRMNTAFESSELLETDRELQLWRTPIGEFWYHGGFSMLSAGVIAEQQMDLYGDRSRGVQPGDVVLDCGADFGTFTRSALDQGAKLVVAIEIAPTKAPCLRRTFRREIAEGRVIVYNKGVWDQDGVLELRGDSVVLDREAEPVRVTVTTIDQIIAELQLDRIDFIKMDIEGAEKRALLGAREAIARFRPTLALAIEHADDDHIRLPQMVRNLAPGYGVSCGPCSYQISFRGGAEFNVGPDTLLLRHEM